MYYILSIEVCTQALGAFVMTNEVTIKSEKKANMQMNNLCFLFSKLGFNDTMDECTDGLRIILLESEDASKSVRLMLFTI